MFSFFRRTPKNKEVVKEIPTVAAKQNGNAEITNSDEKRLSISDTCVSESPTTATNESVSTAPDYANANANSISNSDENSSTNIGRRERSNLIAATPAPAETSSDMAPMAAFRGKGKGKRKPHEQNQTNKQNNETKQNNNVEQENNPPPKVTERHKPLSYANILRRLDSVPPPQSAAKPPEPEKRRHSVKPCSHVTVAATPKAPVTPPPIPTPPGSPIAAIRAARAAKQSKMADTETEVDTVTAAIKLKIDLPKISDTLQCDRTIEKTNSNSNSNTVNKTINTDDDSEKRNLVNQETQFQNQLAELSERLRTRESETNELRIQMEKLERDLYVKSTGVDRLQAELTSAHKDSEFVRQKLKHLQEEVQQYKQKNAEMVDEIQTKTEEYKKLEESSKERTAQLETSVQELTEKLSNLESQISVIKEERDKIESLRAELESEREEEKKIVQEALDLATSENETIRKRWEQDFEKLRTVNTDREQQMLDDFEWKLREVQAACKKRLDDKEKTVEQRIKEAQKDADAKVKKAEEQMNEVKHLKSYEAEVTQLRGLTHDQQHSLRTMSTRLDELQATEQNLQDEISRLHSCIEKEKREQQLLIVRHEKDLLERERTLQIRLEHQRGEVAIQWEQKLRQECARLSGELEQMHSDEKQLAVELVRVQKDREFEGVKEQWEKKLQQHVKEIAELKTTLTKKENKFQNELERLQTNTDRDIVELRRELDKADMSHHERTEKLLEEHEKQVDRLNEEAERKLKELEQNCQNQVSSMRATLELVKEQAAREMEERVERLHEEHRRTNDELWQRLTDEKDQEIERIEEEYKIKFDKIKEQFTVVQKNHQVKEKEFVEKIDQLKNDINEKNSAMKSLQSNVDTLHGGVQVLRQEIVHQDQNVNKIRTEADQKIGELQHALKVERDSLQVEREEHIEEITHLQKQSQAQLEQLQRRCQCLTKLFEDMRSRYDKRDSRAEDLNTISDLRTIIAEQERDLAVLNEEKRYFQMKLMKRDQSPSPPPSPSVPAPNDNLNVQWKNEPNKSPQLSTSDSTHSLQSINEEVEEEEEDVEEEEEFETDSEPEVQIIAA